MRLLSAADPAQTDSVPPLQGSAVSDDDKDSPLAVPLPPALGAGLMVLGCLVTARARRRRLA